MMAVNLDFEGLVTRHYGPLYQFAFSLTRTEADACDLTQQTFYVWATKGSQLRNPSKVKTWLFTTLHRLFLEGRRRQNRFPHQDLDTAAGDLPEVAPTSGHHDCAQVLRALAKVEEPYQAAVALFYLEDLAYKDIAEILNVPLGTVKSRLARGLAQLQKILADDISTASQN